MKQIKLILVIIALLGLTVTFAQQDAQYTQYTYSMNILNPAYAGSRGVTSIGLMARSQWVGVEGAPKTLTASIHAPVGNSVGLGFSIIHDEIGPAKEDNIYIDYSYTIRTSEKGKLAFGLKGGFNILNVNSLITNDPDPLNEKLNKTTVGLGAGIYYYTERYYLGFSIPNFLETLHLDKNAGLNSTASERKHYFLTTGYVFDLTDDIKFKPSTMLKAASGAPLSLDISANLLFQEKFELGLSYRLDDSISAIANIRINSNMRIGYAYDYTTSQLSNFNSGTHEVLILFDLNKRKVKSPRFF
ncbi:MAG: type IX secretion system membrane protein PorP/SprF [Flavobacteriaceae bacterium]|nr:type IX secretion system membrane protein PorP/SprF [Flavobacteriaceae bacterium]